MEPMLDFQPVYSHHDLLIEMGRVEMAMERLQARDEQENLALRPRLETRMKQLRHALDGLPV
ncbi:hypothetical protein [Dyella sp.]|uniref:hypothetical protein n=1 Tax=Dyella sp. TaxID=1869338 RepID=UPI002ED125E9